jgi:streptomycin 6-kinase
MSEPDSPWLDSAPWGLAPWLIARLEATAKEVAAQWGLDLGPRIAAGRYSYVAPAGPDAILKIMPVEDDDADHIADALKLWDGRGAVRLLRHDAERRALLMERLRPGTEAAQVAEDEATAAAIDVGREIWVKPPDGHPFRSIHDWVRRWTPSADAHPLVPAAQRVYEAMTPRLDRIVHTDLHHHNLLKRGDDWVVIDPKPYVGEPEFDVLSFLVNPMGSVLTLERTEKRIRSFSDAGLDADRIRGWAIVRGVLDGLPARPGGPETTRMRVARWLL